MEKLHKLMKNYEEKYSDRRLVFGEGDENTKVMLIGEAPGGEEEKLGRPFVGKAGKNLDRFLELVRFLLQFFYVAFQALRRSTKLGAKNRILVHIVPHRRCFTVWSVVL